MIPLTEDRNKLLNAIREAGSSGFIFDASDVDNIICLALDDLVVCVGRKAHLTAKGEAFLARVAA